MSDNVEPTETLVSLRSSLSEVEETLKPLLERKWTETTASLGTLERAKMDVLVSYAINDLIWVYLKMKGVDPSTHDVSTELERIRTYYGKVKAVEDPETRRTTQIDKGAAGRLINHSIPQKQRLPTSSTPAAVLARSQAEAAVNENVGTSSRFRFVAKDGETERVVASDIGDEDDDDGVEEDALEGQEDAGDEAEELLKDVQEQFDGDRAGVEMDVDEEEENGPDRRKRKRAEDMVK